MSEWTRNVTDPGEYRVRWANYGDEGRVFCGKVDWHDPLKKKNLHFLPFGMKISTMRHSWEFQRIDAKEQP